MSTPPSTLRAKAYKEAGVDIDGGYSLVQRIKSMVGQTHIPGVLSDIGGFGGLFKPDVDNTESPVLVASTDGVGTKLKLAFAWNKHDTVGIDLVAMSANDILVQGAKPLFFLDYFATGKLSVDEGARVINGIAEGCRRSGCALIGGETAEMPGMYHDGDFDLAGFAVGAMERGSDLPKGVKDGDVLLGLTSDGVHSNGFSLVRRVAEAAGLGWQDAAPFADGTLGQALLVPTRLYVQPALAAIRAGGVHGLAHITGGGLTENLPRILPEGLGAEIDLGAWALPPVFTWLAEAGGVTAPEMLKTFNCGIGMVLVVDAARAEDLSGLLGQMGETVVPLGHVVPGQGVRYSGTLA